VRSGDGSASIDEDVDGIIGSRVTRNWLVAVVRVVLAQVVAGIVFLVLSHELKPSDYALYVVAAIAAPMAYSLVATPVGLVLIRRPGTLDRRSVDAGFTFLCGYVVLGVLLLAVPIAVVGSVPRLLVGIGAAYVMSLVLAFPAYVVLQRNLQSARTSIVELVDRVAFQLTAMFVVLAGVSVERAVAGGLVVAGLSVVLLSQLFVRWRPRLRSPRHIAAELRDSVNPFLVVGTSLAVEGGLVPMVGMIAGATQAGLYGWAYGILAIPTGFVHAATTTLYPAFVRVADQHLRRAFRLASRLVAAMAVIGAATVAASIPTLIGTIFPERWDQAVPAVWLLLAALVVYAATSVANTYWNARRSLARFARWQVLATIVTFAVAASLASRYGATGAAAGYLCGRVVLAAALVRAMAREEDLRIGWSVVAFVGASVAAASVGLLVDARMQDGWVQLAVVVAATLVTAVVALELVMRGRMRSDLGEAWRMFRPGSPTDGGEVLTP
jgi:O-antigen/teichoic acid export membrane protein